MKEAWMSFWRDVAYCWRHEQKTAVLVLLVMLAGFVMMGLIVITGLAQYL